MDIIVANQNDDNVSIFLGYGNGSFANQLKYSTGSYPQSVAVGDFNNDTHLDIIVTNVVDNNVGVLLGSRNGSFGTQRTYPIGASPSLVAVGDFNNDTRLDVALLVNVDDNNPGMNVLLGYGDGSFTSVMTYTLGSIPNAIIAGDFNNGGGLDVAVINAGNNNVGIFHGYLTEAFYKETMLITGKNSRPRSFVIEDFNNDGLMDVAVANSGTDSIGIFLGHGHISFANQKTFSTSPHSSPYSIAAADFNNDTFLDIVVANYQSSNVGIFLGFGNGSFANQTTYLAGSEPKFIAARDFNNDTIPDIVVANYGSNNLGIFLGYGDGTFAEMILVSLEYGSRPFFVLVGDFNNDRKLDFAVANNGTDSLYILLQTC